jgi:xanthine/uracil permease
MGYLGLVGMTWGWLVGAVMGQVSLHYVCDKDSIHIAPPFMF